MNCKSTLIELIEHFIRSEGNIYKTPKSKRGGIPTPKPPTLSTKKEDNLDLYAVSPEVKFDTRISAIEDKFDQMLESLNNLQYPPAIETPASFEDQIENLVTKNKIEDSEVSIYKNLDDEDLLDIAQSLKIKNCENMDRKQLLEVLK